MRQKLPNRRAQTSYDLSVPGLPTVVVSVGFYDDGVTPGEVFITTNKKDGAQFSLECADAAVLLSLALQHGVPLETLWKSLHKDEKGDQPVTVIGCVIQDLITRWGSDQHV